MPVPGEAQRARSVAVAFVLTRRPLLDRAPFRFAFVLWCTFYVCLCAKVHGRFVEPFLAQFRLTIVPKKRVLGYHFRPKMVPEKRVLGTIWGPKWCTTPARNRSGGGKNKVTTFPNMFPKSRPKIPSQTFPKPPQNIPEISKMSSCFPRGVVGFV